jgi:hypothetical protein
MFPMSFALAVLYAMNIYYMRTRNIYRNNWEGLHIVKVIFMMILKYFQIYFMVKAKTV